MSLKAPFPYFGGKSKFAAEIWERLGQVDNYVEPFLGSGAVLLANPKPARREIVFDADGLVCNFWRAIQTDPDAVAWYADWPSIAHDLPPRSARLTAWRVENRDRLLSDPEHYDPRMAGWWAWALSVGIKFDNSVGGGRGVNSLTVHRLGTQRPAGGLSRGERLRPWFAALARRLEGVTVLATSWHPGLLSPTVLGDTAMRKQWDTAVFLDPPYLTDRRYASLYESDAAGTSDSVATSTYDWAVANGERYKIAYCCLDGDFPCPPGWSQVARLQNGLAKERRREVIYFSPRCELLCQQPNLL